MIYIKFSELYHLHYASQILTVMHYKYSLHITTLLHCIVRDKHYEHNIYIKSHCSKCISNYPSCIIKCATNKESLLFELEDGVFFTRPVPDHFQR